MESPTSALKLSTLSSLDRVTITLERLMVQYDPNTSISKLAEDLDRRLSLPDGVRLGGRARMYTLLGDFSRESELLFRSVGCYTALHRTLQEIRACIVENDPTPLPTSSHPRQMRQGGCI